MPRRIIPPRRLPPLPDGADPTSPDIVRPLLEGYVLSLGDEYSAPEEGLTFKDLLENSYPAAWKAYQNFHWTAHFQGMIESVQSSITKVAKRKAILRKAIRDAAEEAGEEFTETEIEIANHPVFKMAHAVGAGVQKRIMIRTRPELLETALKHEKSGQSRILSAEFHRELAARLTNDTETVADRWKKTEVIDLLGEKFEVI